MKYFLASFFIAFLCRCDDAPSMKTGLEGKEMPSFNLLLMDSSSNLNTNSIPSGQPIVMFLITPFCPFCRAETRDIVDHLEVSKNIRLYILTSSPFNQVKNYYHEFQLNKYPNITVGQDYRSYLGNYFKVEKVPFIAIYDKNKRLKKVLSGRVPIHEIEKFANE